MPPAVLSLLLGWAGLSSSECNQQLQFPSRRWQLLLLLLLLISVCLF